MYDYGPPDKWDWVPISEVLGWYSVDAGMVIACPDCGHAVDEVDENGTSFDLLCYTCDEIIQYTMEQVLESKREDEDYDDIVKSLHFRGWVYPLHRWGKALTDGHHRLAAAIDLGMVSVPTFPVDDARQDHGEWEQEIDNAEERALSDA